jgi:diaminopimelate decarboxylase
MEGFGYRADRYFAEDVSLEEVAEVVGTPCYVYSRAVIEHRYGAFDRAFGGHPHRICYAVKANGNLALLRLLARLGAGFDIVSGGELERVLMAGGDAGDVVFSGVGKSAAEIRRALEAGIGSLNVESEAELERVAAIAVSLSMTAPVSVRVNPDVDPQTHPYIATGLRDNKFGVPLGRALDVYRAAARMDGLRIVGVACHIGSQLVRLDPFADTFERILNFVDTLRAEGITIDHLDLGGGLGVRYRDETPPEPAEYVAMLLQRLAARDCGLPVTLEPGRAIVANAGVLLTRVEYLKQGEGREFAVVDAGMNDLLRPSLYQSWQEIVPVRRNGAGSRTVDVVGPVCESADFLGKDRSLAVEAGDLLAVRTAGAYGAAMASNYNARPRPAEVLVDGGRFDVVRSRDRIDQLFENERIPDHLSGR